MKKILLHKEKLIVFSDQVIVSASAFLTNIFLAKTLGLENYGLFSSALLVQLFILSIFISFASQVVQVTYNKLEVSIQKQYISGLFYIIIVIITILFFIGIAISILSSSGLIASVTVCTAALLIQDFLRKYFIIINQTYKSLLMDLTTNILQIITLFILWHLNLLTITNSFIAIGVTFIPSILMGILWLKVDPYTTNSYKMAWKIHSEKSKWLILSAILQWFGGYFFVIAAGWWIGPAALGALRLLQYLFGTLNILLQAVENYLLPKLYQIKDKNTYQNILTKKMLLIIAPFIFLLVIFSNFILEQVGGKEYIQYSYIMYGLAIIYVVMTINYPIRMMIRSNSFEKEFFIGYVLMFFFSTITAAYLIKNFQLYGVLIGLLGTQIIAFVYWSYILRSKLSYKGNTN